MSRAVLLAGGAGYIGAHVARRLYRAGYSPVVYDDLSAGHASFALWGPLEVGRLEDGPRLRAAIARHRPVAALHFAAHACVGESVAEPAKYYGNNVGGTLSLLEALREHGVSRLVFSSTCAVYGAPAGGMLAEDAVPDPVNPYGRSKRMVEQILEDYGRAYGLKAVSLRYFNAAGADAEGLVGEARSNETHLIPLLLDAVSGRIPKVLVHGDDYPTLDGTCVRDYVHVEDLAEAHWMALGHLEGGGESLALNLGTGVGYSVREVIAAVEKVTGRHVPVEVGPRRPGDPPVLVAAARRAQALWGWTPSRSTLWEMVESAWRWHQGGARALRG